MSLATRSAIWKRIKTDLEEGYAEFQDCLQNQEKNKRQPKLEEEDLFYPFQKLTMDIGQTGAGEHILAITNRFSGFIWAGKTGDKNMKQQKK